jgi:GTPase
MKSLPKLAIVGRPNVGKSALFNRICERRIAIVDEAEGITRDRLYADGELFGFRFEVIDTGGINPRSKAEFNEEIRRQAEIAIEEADTIIQVVDAKVGITDLDKEVALVLLRCGKPVCLAVNKIDDISQENLLHQFHSLGINKKVTVSAEHGWHIVELLEEAFSSFPRGEQEESGSSSIKVAIVGRPNVGKSSLVNYLLDDNRCIVSPIPGTTRDSVDVSFEYQNQLYTLIDTAGIRRKRAEHEVVDKFAFIRTERAIERADLCVLMIDVVEGLTAQDKKIANMIEEAGKGCVLLFNKWDLVKGFRMEHCLQSINEEVPFLSYCPKLFTSATTGRNLDKLFDHVQEVYQASSLRITTHQLNKFIEKAMQRNHPPMMTGKRLRIYYMAQVDINPPRFIYFVNKPDLMAGSYKKYLYNQFRETYPFPGVPLLFHLKGKKKRDKPTDNPPLQAAHKHHNHDNENDDYESFEDFDENEFDDSEK